MTAPRIDPELVGLPEELLELVEDPKWPGQWILPGVEIAYRGWPEAPGMKPLAKWAGGKRWAIRIFAPLARLHLANTGGRYIEPFCGGAAVAFWMGWPRTVIGDTCRPLIETYAAVQACPDDVVASLADLVGQGTNETAYYRIRKWRPRSRVEFAGWFLYLNKAGFNGLWRENRRGEFNVPWGKNPRPAFATPGALRRASSVMQSWEIRCEDFESVLAEAGEGDCVYCDPPYLGTVGGFTAYVQASWTPGDQLRLTEAVEAAIGRGATVVCSDGGSEENRSLYGTISGMQVLPVAAFHAIGATGERRGRRREWLATNRPEILSSEGVR